MTEGTVRLGRDGVRTGWVAGVTLTVLGVAGLVLLPVNWYFGLVFILFPGLTMLFALTRLGDDHVVLGPDGVEVLTDRRRYAWEWSQILEIGLTTQNSWRRVTVVHVRPEGKPFDQPGPNEPLEVILPVFGSGPVGRVRRHLEEACAAHGVPFHPDGERMATEPRPGSSLRSDRTDRTDRTSTDRRGREGPSGATAG